MPKAGLLKDPEWGQPHPSSPWGARGWGGIFPSRSWYPPTCPPPCPPRGGSSSRKASGPRGAARRLGRGPGPGVGALRVQTERSPRLREKEASAAAQRQHRQRGGEGGAGGGAGSTSTRVAQGSSGSELSRAETHISHVSLAGPTAGRCNGGGLWAAPTLEPRSLKMISTSKIFPNCCRDRDGGGRDRRGWVKTAGPVRWLSTGTAAHCLRLVLCSGAGGPFPPSAGMCIALLGWPPPSCAEAFSCQDTCPTCVSPVFLALPPWTLPLAADSQP